MIEAMFGVRKMLVSDVPNMTLTRGFLIICVHVFVSVSCLESLSMSMCHMFEGKVERHSKFHYSSYHSLAFVNLQNECAKTKREFHEQNKYVERLRQKLDNVPQFPIRMAEETKQKLTIPSKAILADESKAAVVEVCVTILAEN